MEIQVGDLVTAYWKGYFRVVEVVNMCKPLDEDPRIMAVPEGHSNAGEIFQWHIHIQQEYDSKGKPRKSKEVKVCDSSFCELAKEVIPGICHDLYLTRDRLLDIFDTL